MCETPPIYMGQGPCGGFTCACCSQREHELIDGAAPALDADCFRERRRNRHFTYHQRTISTSAWRALPSKVTMSKEDMNWACDVYAIVTHNWHSNGWTQQFEKAKTALQMDGDYESAQILFIKAAKQYGRARVENAMRLLFL